MTGGANGRTVSRFDAMRRSMKPFSLSSLNPFPVIWEWILLGVVTLAILVTYLCSYRQDTKAEKEYGTDWDEKKS